MDSRLPNPASSPYRFFTAAEWATFRGREALTLSADEVRRLRSLGDRIDLEEVERIYLAMSRLLYAHVESSQTLFRQRRRFLRGSDQTKTPSSSASPARSRPARARRRVS